MREFIYSSILKNEIVDFITLSESKGYKYKNRFIWESLDKYLVSIDAVQKDLTPQIIDNWISTSCNGLTARTVNDYISYYNSLAKYLNSVGIKSYLAEFILTNESYSPYIFSFAEIEKIVVCADNGKSSKEKLSKIQFPLLFRILYGCGLRLGETLILRKSDIDFENGVLRICNAKGNKDRLVPMHESLTVVLKMYCDYFNTIKQYDYYLFESNYKDGTRNCIGKPRNPSWAQRNFKRILKEIGIETHNTIPNQRGVCLHCLRHTFAVNSFRKQDLEGIDNYRSSPAANMPKDNDNCLLPECITKYK